MYSVDFRPRLKILASFLLLRMAGAVHGTACASTATGRSSLFLIPHHSDNDSHHYNKHHCADNDRRHIFHNPYKHTKTSCFITRIRQNIILTCHDRTFFCLYIVWQPDSIQAATHYFSLTSLVLVHCIRRHYLAAFTLIFVVSLTASL